jgi:RNA polymerase sigma-70 factor, ECF subfamily
MASWGESVTDQIVPESRDGSPSTSMSLLRLALAEDREAWERIVFLYSPLVERWCRCRGLNEHETKDVGQEVFLALYKNLDKFRKDEPGHSFRKWLRTITEHNVLDYFRKKQRQPHLLGGAEEVEPTYAPDAEAEIEAADESEQLVVLQRCLEVIRTEFEPRTFDAFWLVTDGKPPAEIASTLSMTTGAVYTARSRITRRLREMLTELEDELPN